MDKIFSRLMYVLGFIVVVVFFSGWFTNKKEPVPELPATLANVKCLPKPNNETHAKNNRALLKYDTYSIYDICIPAEMMPYKDKLKCGYDMNYEESCNEQAVLQKQFVHANISDIYATNKANSKTPNPKSEITIQFSQQALYIHKADFKYYTTQSYITKGIIIPNKFFLRGDPVCEAPLDGKPQGKSQVIRDKSTCFVDIAFGKLNISLEINILANSSKKLKRSQQIDEVNFWLKFINELVVAN